MRRIEYQMLCGTHICNEMQYAPNLWISNAHVLRPGTSETGMWQMNSSAFITELLGFIVVNIQALSSFFHSFYTCSHISQQHIVLQVKEEKRAKIGWQNQCHITQDGECIHIQTHKSSQITKLLALPFVLHLL